MVRINLASAQNEKIRNSLDSPGYTTAEFSHTSCGKLLEACTATPGSYTLLQLETGSSGITSCPPDTLSSLAASTRLVCFADEITPSARQTLISAGVCDCLCSTDPRTAASYLDTLCSGTVENYGTFAVLDRNKEHVRILSGIVSRFGYSVMQAGSVEDFYSYISTNTPVMTLINIGTDVDFNRFIRQSHASSIKKSPVIAYKDLSEGLFVHEVLNGLGRITKLILSPEELFRMLIDMLIKKSIVSGVTQLSFSADYDRYKHYRGMTLQQMYYEVHADPCGQEPILAQDRTDVMMRDIEGIRRSLVLGEGIKWLSGCCSSKATCGAGA